MGRPRDVFAADFDLDGDQDFLVAESFPLGGVSWLENFGGGGFSPKKELATGGDAKGVWAADLDGDGDLDALAADSQAGTILWYESDGAGSFGPPQLIGSPGGIMWSVVAGDLDGDGDQDVVSVSVTKVLWYRSDGTGGFDPGVQVVGSSQSQKAALADLDGDGDLDILFSGGGVGWCENTDALGTFAPPAFLSGPLSNTVRAADLNTDGTLDVAAGGPSLNWFAGAPAGTFGPAQSLPAGAAGPLVPGDVDEDGDPDLLAGTPPSWFSNTDGMGTFASPTYLDPQVAADTLVLVDVDLDGEQDLFVGAAAVGDLSSLSSGAVGWFSGGGSGAFSGFEQIAPEAGFPRSLDVADINGDALPDPIAYSLAHGRVSMWLQVAGKYPDDAVVDEAAVTGTVPTRAILAVDLNGDGARDIVSVHDNTVSWWANDGVGGMGTRQVVTPLSSVAAALHTVDVDGDGDLDLVVTDGSDDRVSWFRNMDGLGSFGPELPIDLPGAMPAPSTSADLDNDGDIDLSSAALGQVRWYENTDGAGSFATPVSISPVGATTWPVSAGDLDGDGDTDLAYIGSAGVIWLPNLGGGGGLGSPITIDSSSQAVELELVDFDADGDLDVLAAADTITWYPANGFGGFGSSVPLTSDLGIRDIQASDQNGDGRPDLLVLSQHDIYQLTWDPSSSAQVVRLGSPPNPAAFVVAPTDPIIGQSWEPYVDHSTFMPSYLIDVLTITGGPANVPLPGVGTILCDASTVLIQVVGTQSNPGFSIPIPPIAALAGTSYCAQVVTNWFSVWALTNAIDVTL